MRTFNYPFGEGTFKLAFAEWPGARDSLPCHSFSANLKLCAWAQLPISSEAARRGMQTFADSCAKHVFWIRKLWWALISGLDGFRAK
jgi:hypothetical protein